MIHLTVPRLCSFLSDRRGASAIEFAIVVTPLLVIVFGSIEFGRLLWTREALQETVISSSRCMGVKQNSCTSSGAYSETKTLSYVQSRATSWSITLPTSAVSLNDSATCGGTAGFSQVSIAYTFQTAVPILLGSLANGIPISATACFPNQG